MPSIANSVAKNSCLICLCDRKVVANDTEWHLLFGCCATTSNRSKYLASLRPDPLPAASLPTISSPSTLVNHFLFARESSENLRIFAQFVKDSLHTRQKCLRRVQAQCPDSIFTEAENFQKEASDISLPDLHESQSPQDSPATEQCAYCGRLGCDCPACKGRHRKHTCGGKLQQAQQLDDTAEGQHQIPAQASETSYRKRQASANSPPGVMQRKHGKST